jgi:hypothetical protein
VPIAGDRWYDDIETEGGLVAGAIRERFEDVDVLEEAARPAVGEEERHGDWLR